MHTMHTPAILSRLQSVQQAKPDQWYAQCPCHQDTKPSLGISINPQGNTLLNCLAGCATTDIVAALGMTLADLFAEPVQRGQSKSRHDPNRRIDTVYKYYDEHSNYLYEVVRYIPKDFKQRIHNQDGTYTYSVPERLTTLYRLPELVSACKASLERTVWIVEGEKDVDNLRRGGFVATTCPGGATKWKTRYSRFLEGARVAIIPDNDRAPRSDGTYAGEAHAQDIARHLNGVALSVKIVRLPPIPGCEAWIKDISDYIQANGSRDALLQALADATEFEPSQQHPASSAAPASTPHVAGGVTTLPGAPATIDGIPSAVAELLDFPVPSAFAKRDDPARLASEFLLQHLSPDGHKTLRRFNKLWYSFDGQCYREKSDESITSAIVRHIQDTYVAFNQQERNTWIANGRKQTEPKPLVMNTAVVNMAYKAIAANCEVERGTTESRHAPFWVDDGPPNPHKHLKPEHLLIARNCIVSIDKAVANEIDCTIPLTPALFAVAAVDYDYDPQAECPHWEQTLFHNIPDLDTRIFLQQWFGYNLLPITSFQRFLFLWGEGCNGKSVICAALEALLGSASVSHVHLEEFASQFGLYPMVGKLANIVADCGDIDKLAEGKLKSISAGDTIMYERKFHDPISAKPTARITIAANTKPRIADKSDGIWRRMICVNMIVTIPDEKKIEDMDKPHWWVERGECPGLLNWAIHGLIDLFRSRKFLEPQGSKDEKELYKQETNPAREFLEGVYMIQENGEVEFADMYERYVAWCGRNGHRPMSSNIFSRELPRVFPGVERDRKGKRNATIVKGLILRGSLFDDLEFTDRF